MSKLPNFLTLLRIFLLPLPNTEASTFEAISSKEKGPMFL